MVQLETHQGHSQVGECRCPTAPHARKESKRAEDAPSSLVAQTKQRSVVLLKSDAAKWLGEDVRGVVLAFDILRLD
eukprot:3034792-Pleurochrysis_carterae.AAC.1